MTPTKLLTEARKALVVAAAVIAQVLELGLLHGSALHYATVASTVVAAVLVYFVPNGATSGSALPLEQPALPAHNYPPIVTRASQPAVTLTQTGPPAAATPPTSV